MWTHTSCPHKPVLTFRFPGVRCQMTQVDVAKQSAGNAYCEVFLMTCWETPAELEQEGTWK